MRLELRRVGHEPEVILKRVLYVEPLPRAVQFTQEGVDGVQEIDLVHGDYGWDGTVYDFLTVHDEEA